ncbi:hypothetical protein JTB14_018186 [Gonioctena quinquepunctata]|nr:hypothetical protein JTB14_018186 [Gonioctena quinquepunctata]
MLPDDSIPKSPYAPRQTKLPMNGCLSITEDLLTANHCLPGWFLLLKFSWKKYVRSSEYDPLVEEVELIDVNPQYARVRLEDGRETTVSLRHLALNGKVQLESRPIFL